MEKVERSWITLPGQFLETEGSLQVLRRGMTWWCLDLPVSEWDDGADVDMVHDVHDCLLQVQVLACGDQSFQSENSKPHYVILISTPRDTWWWSWPNINNQLETRDVTDWSHFLCWTAIGKPMHYSFCLYQWSRFTSSNYTTKTLKLFALLSPQSQLSTQIISTIIVVSVYQISPVASVCVVCCCVTTATVATSQWSQCLDHIRRRQTASNYKCFITITHITSNISYTYTHINICVYKQSMQWPKLPCFIT